MGVKYWLRPSKQTWECRNPTRVLIRVLDVFGSKLSGKKRLFPHMSTFRSTPANVVQQLFIQCVNRIVKYSGSLRSAQALHSQQPGIYKRGCFPWTSSSGVSVSRWHKFILQAVWKRPICPISCIFKHLFQVHWKQPDQVDFTECFPRAENLSASVSMQIKELLLIKNCTYNDMMVCFLLDFFLCERGRM